MPRPHALIFYLALFSLTSLVISDRPADIPTALPCSSPQIGQPYQLPVGNAGTNTYSLYFLSSDTCSETAVGSIAVSGTVYTTSYVGRSWYARDPSGNIVDTFVASSKDLNWYLQVNIHQSKSANNSVASNATTSDSNVITANGPSSANNMALILGLSISLSVLALLIITGLFYRFHSAASRVKVRKVYTVVSPHHGVLDDELSVALGDRVEVRAIFDDGWISAGIVGGNRVGMV